MLTGGLSLAAVALRSPEAVAIRAASLDALADIAPAVCPRKIRDWLDLQSGFSERPHSYFRPPRPRKTRCWTEGVPTPQGDGKWTAATMTRLRQRLVGRRQHLGIIGSASKLSRARRRLWANFSRNAGSERSMPGCASPGFTFRAAPEKAKQPLNPVNPGIPVGIVGIVGIV